MPEQSGFVKHWNEERGFGFVTVNSGEDVYVHRTVLQDGQVLAKDAQVWVEAQWDAAKAKWAATRCSGAAGKGDGKGFDGGAAPGKGKGKGKGKRGVDWMAGIGATVKSWTEERGFGFVSTPQGEDIYCHRTTLTDGSVLNIGAEVSVDANWNWEKNKWHATKVIGASGDPPRSQTAGFETPNTTGVQTGTVKAWHEKGGYGFLVPDNGGPDVFCHSSALTEGTKGFKVGESVTFDLQRDEKKGKYLAVSCFSNEAGGGFGPMTPGKVPNKAEPYADSGLDAELAAKIDAIA